VSSNDKCDHSLRSLLVTLIVAGCFAIGLALVSLALHLSRPIEPTAILSIWPKIKKQFPPDAWSRGSSGDVGQHQQMNSSIALKKIWQDEDMVELTISVTDGTSLFQCNTYVGHQTLAETVKNLHIFKDHVYGGLYDLRFGEFGPEYANGAFHARFEFHRSGNGKLSITVKSESDWEEFTHTKVASNATLYLKTEPALFDTWISALKGLSQGNRNEAVLECI